MKPITSANIIMKCLAPLTAVMLSGCDGIFNDIYDEPDIDSSETRAGQLYLNASDWEEWHYIDLVELSECVESNPDFNPSSLWQTYRVIIPDSGQEAKPTGNGQSGIYTYWYDVYGEGISKYEFQSFSPSEQQPEPDNWTVAVHRNNVRTNGGEVAETSYTSISELPSGNEWITNLTFTPDEWNQTDVWTIQDRMLSGIIGNQGIHVNNVLSGWLKMEIPPMPPSFVLNSHVFIIKLMDETLAAIQLADYIGADGTKCCLTINYKYPL